MATDGLVSLGRFLGLPSQIILANQISHLVTCLLKITRESHTWNVLLFGLWILHNLYTREDIWRMSHSTLAEAPFQYDKWKERLHLERLIPYIPREFCAWFLVDTWPSCDLTSQNYLGWRAKESAQRYQTTLSVSFLLAEMVGWEQD